MQYITHTLTNGLRIIHAQVPSKVAYCGIAINGGSRDEASGKFGLAHFVEHTIFKGTTHRRAWHINNRMESVGGELNAYTSKEETLLYSIFPGENFNRAVELIADLVKNSVFPECELAKEREVVLDEASSYRDSPSEAVYDDFEDMIFSNHGLGHNILGSESCLRSISSEDCRTFIDQLYVPTNMVFFSVGDFPAHKIIKLVEREFGAMSNPLTRIERVVPSKVTPFQVIQSAESHQSHTIYGAPIFGMYDNRKYAMALLTNMIGGNGMNSLLNVALRERRGYVYTVEAATTLFTDTGLFTIYFGSDDCHVKPCLRIIRKQIEQLANDVLSDKALDMAKRQYAGQLIVSNENRENVALSLGKGMLYFNKVSPIDEISERIYSITKTEIQEAASLLVPELASTLTLR